MWFVSWSKWCTYSTAYSNKAHKLNNQPRKQLMNQIPWRKKAGKFISMLISLIKLRKSIFSGFFTLSLFLSHTSRFFHLGQKIRKQWIAEIAWESSYPIIFSLCHLCVIPGVKSPKIFLFVWTKKMAFTNTADMKKFYNVVYNCWFSKC